MLLLKKNSFTVETDSPVVDAADAAALAKAEEIVAAAEAEAARLADEAKKAYEAEKARGYADGIAEGKQDILLQKLDLVDESLQYMASVEGKVTDVVLKALSKCVAEIGDRELVVQIVKKSMQAVVRTQKEITIRVAEDMVPVVRERLTAMMVDFPSVVKADVVADERLSGAACVVETESGMVEASIEGQLEAIAQNMRKCFERE